MAGIIPDVRALQFERGHIGEGYLNLIGNMKEDGWASEAERPIKPETEKDKSSKERIV